MNFKPILRSSCIDTSKSCLSLFFIPVVNNYFTVNHQLNRKSSHLMSGNMNTFIQSCSCCASLPRDDTISNGK